MIVEWILRRYVHSMLVDCFGERLEAFSDDVGYGISPVFLGEDVARLGTHVDRGDIGRQI